MIFRIKKGQVNSVGLPLFTKAPIVEGGVDYHRIIFPLALKKIEKKEVSGETMEKIREKRFGEEFGERFGEKVRG